MSNENGDSRLRITPRKSALDILKEAALPEVTERETLREYLQARAGGFRQFLDRFPRSGRDEAWRRILSAIEDERGVRPNKGTIATYLSQCKENRISVDDRSLTIAPTQFSPKQGSNRYVPRRIKS